MKEWFTAEELKGFGLPDLPNSPQGINKRAKTDDWMRQRGTGSAQAWEYHFSSLPTRAQAALLRKLRALTPQPNRETVKTQLASADAWARFEALPEARKQKARDRLAVLQDVRRLWLVGTPKEPAVELICKRAKVPTRTYYEWETRTHGYEESDWLPQLVDHYAGRQATVEMSPEAWDYFLADFLTQSQPAASAVYARLMEIAAEKEWVVPSLKTIQRRIEKEIPPAVLVLKRKGPEAAERLFPAQRRDRSSLHALQAVNADGHKFDVFVKWPDDVVGRPVIFVFQDLYSGKILSWRIDRTENTQSFRLAFGDMLEQWGIPEKVLLDNTRVAANKKMSGGVPNRFRFKVKEDDPVGLLPQLGIEVIWATPYHGQAKPIERAFRDLCETVAKHPLCVGAYTGNNPSAKPENYGSKAVPLADFIALVDREIKRHNGRPGRTAANCKGRSFDETFAASYEAAPIRRNVDDAVRRLWLLEADAVTAQKPDGHVELLGNRYWHSELNRLIGTKLVVRFDPDFLKKPVHIYRLDGAFVCTADCFGDKGFFDQAAAKENQRAKKAFTRAVKDQAAALVKMDATAAAAMRPTPEAEIKPEAKVVKPLFNDPTKRRTVEAAPISAEEEARLDALAAEIAAPSPVITLDTVETRFRRLLEIEGRIEAGQYVSPDDRAWAERQSRLPDIKTQREMYEVFGEDVLTA